MKNLLEVNKRNQINLISLNKFFLEKGDKLVEKFINNSDYISLKTITKEYFQENFLNIFTYVTEYSQIYEDDFNSDDFPIEWYNDDIIETIINKRDVFLHMIPYTLRTYEICIKAVRDDGYALKYVPLYLKDYKMCKLAVLNNGWAITYVPTTTPNYKSICKFAVTNRPNSLNRIPIKFIDYNLCSIAVTYRPHTFFAVPNKFKDYKLCKKAVLGDGGNLQYVPMKLRDYNLCKIAVSNNFYSLEYIPKTIENYYELVKKYVQNFSYLSPFYEKWFPKEYIPQLKKDFPDNKELQNYTLQEYISKEVRKLLKEYYLK
jgi:hypothetical protein